MNLQQQRFVAAYIKTGNATQSAIKAGYSKRSAHTTGQRLLKHAEVCAALRGSLQKAADSMDLTAERVLQELARLAFFDVRKLLNPDGTPKAIGDLDDDTAAAIAGLEVASVGNAEMGVGQVLKYKVADKNSAIDKAMKHLRLLTDKVELTGKDGADLMQPTDNEIARRLAFVLTKGLKETQ